MGSADRNVFFISDLKHKVLKEAELISHIQQQKILTIEFIHIPAQKGSFYKLKMENDR
jgi:hypothetical protein